MDPLSVGKKRDIRKGEIGGKREIRKGAIGSEHEIRKGSNPILLSADSAVHGHCFSRNQSFDFSYQHSDKKSIPKLPYHIFAANGEVLKLLLVTDYIMS